MNCVVNHLYIGHWKSVVICCGLPEVREHLADLVKDAISRPHGVGNQIVDIADLIPKPAPPENSQLEI